MSSLNALLIKLLSLAFNQQTTSKEISVRRKTEDAVQSWPGETVSIQVCSSQVHQANETGTHLSRDFTHPVCKGFPILAA